MLLMLLVAQTICMNCFGDIAILGGYAQIDNNASNYPTYPMADSFNLYGSSSFQVGIPVEEQGLIECLAVNSYDGTVIYVGFHDVLNLPFIYRGSVVSPLVSPIIIPGNGSFGISCVAIASNGTAVFGGYDENRYPVIFTLSPGKSELDIVTISSSDMAAISSVAVDSEGRAFFVGQNISTLTPIIFSLVQGSSAANSISLPNSNTGYLTCIAMGDDGTAIVGGRDTSTTNGNALIYEIPKGSSTANLITVSNFNDYSIINGVAIGPDGTAILVGAIGGSPFYPLVLTIASGNAYASNLMNPNANEGYLGAVAIGSDGIAIMGGGSNNLPLVYRLFPGDLIPISIDLPIMEEGAIDSIAIGAQNIAVLTGVYYSSNQWYQE